MVTGIMSLTFLDDEGVNPEWQFALAIFLLYAVGYPIGHTAVIGLFSKSKFGWNIELTQLDARPVLILALSCIRLQLLEEGHKESSWDGSLVLAHWPE